MRNFLFFTIGWLIYIAVLLSLFACGQTNQAMDCVRQGNQCADQIKGSYND